MADKMTNEEAAKAISEKVSEAYAAINAAESIADEYKLDFNFSVAYGMGGYYNGDPEDRDDDDDEMNDGWSPSSQGC